MKLFPEWRILCCGLSEFLEIDPFSVFLETMQLRAPLQYCRSRTRRPTRDLWVWEREFLTLNNFFQWCDHTSSPIEIESVHEWPGQCSWYFRKSDLSKTEYRKYIFGGNSYQDSWISLYASDESSIKHRGKKKSGPCNLGDSSFSGSCRVRLDVVDLLVAQYPGTAPTRILLHCSRY